MSKLRSIRNRLIRNVLSKGIVLKYVLKNLPPEFQEIKVVYDDYQLSIDPRSNFDIALVRNGLGHREKIQAIRSLIPETSQEGTVLELGSHVGSETITLILEGFDNVVCVEPDPVNVEKLKKNIKLNGIADRTTIICAAVGDREAEATLNRDSLNPNTSSLVWNAASDSQTKIPLHTVNKLLKLAQRKPSDISLVWMDIEGYELKAFRSMSELVKQGVPIFFEYTGGEMQGNLVHTKEEIRAFVNSVTPHYDQCYMVDTDGVDFKAIDLFDLENINRQVDILLVKSAEISKL